MDTYENENKLPEEAFPVADTPCQCAYTVLEAVAVEKPEADNQEPAAPKVPKTRKRRPFLSALVLILCCAATAFAVTSVWQNRFDRMEMAMSEKFDALEQLYSEQKNSGVSSQLPVQGPLTPAQVYAKNVDAVVAITSRYQVSGGYNEGYGSGFVTSADGYVVTNHHVIDKANQIEVTFHNGETLQAKVVGYEADNDVALLKVEGESLPCVTMGSSDAMEVGAQVVAIGNPLGELTASLTVGYISAKDRIVNTDGTVINMLQTDAAINSGNSGGPLFNMNGEVVGITTAKFTGSSNSGTSIEGLGFAIPTDDVVGILSDLKQFGYVTGVYLGVYVRDVSESAQTYGLPAGAYVEQTVSGYCSQKAGVRAGDIIVNLGGYDVDSVTTLTRALRRFKVGQTVSMTVYRNGKQEYLSVTLDEKPVQTQQPTVEETQPAPEENENNNGGGFGSWFDFFAPFF